MTPRDGAALLAKYRRVAEARKTGDFDAARAAFREAVGLGPRADDVPATRPEPQPTPRAQTRGSDVLRIDSGFPTGYSAVFGCGVR